MAKLFNENFHCGKCIQFSDGGMSYQMVAEATFYDNHNLDTFLHNKLYLEDFRLIVQISEILNNRA